MPLGKNRIYLVLAAASVAGYVWLVFNILRPRVASDPRAEVCLMKHLINVPCPSCGSTRSVVALLNGNLSEALHWNPIGIILLLGMVIVPWWIAHDLLTRKRTLIAFYEKMETLLRKKSVALPLALLILINWIWNIFKQV